MPFEHTAAPDQDQETFQTAFKFAPVGMAFLSLSGKWLRANRALCDTLGLSEQDLLATTMEAILHPKDTEPVARYLKNIRDGAILGYQMEVRYLHPRGNPVWVTQSAALIPDADGSPSSLLVQIQDITLRKQAEEALRESELKYRTLMDGMSEAVMRVDNDDVVQFVNPQFCQLTGYGEDELLGRVGCEIYFDPEQQELIREKNRLRLERVTDAYETVMRKKNGEELLVRISGSPVTAARGQVTGSIGVITDITARKRAEQALRESEEKFRILIQNQGEGIAMADLEERFTFANPAAEVLFGVPPGKLVGRKLEDFMAPEQFTEVLEQTWKRNFGEKSSYELEILRPDGERRSLLVTACPRNDPQGKFLGTFGIFRDITLRKQAEEELARLSRQNELVLSSAAEGIMGLNLQGNHTFVNPAAAKMLGYEAEELLGRPSHSTWHHTKPDGSPYPREECPIYAAFRDGAVHRVSTDVFWRKDGVSFPVEYASMPIYEQGRLAGAVVTFSDITLRKQAEEDLRESEQRFRAIFDNSNDGILLADMEKKRFFIGNKTICQMLGYSPDEIKELGVMDIHPPEDLPYVIGQFEKQARKETAVAKDLPVKRKDGRVFYADVSSFPITLAGKSYLVGAFRDITLRKQAEAERERLIAELQEALAKVKTLSGLLPICASCKKIRDDKGYWNQIEVYIGDRAEVDFSHGICPDCAKRLYPEIYEKMMLRKENGGQS